MHARNRVIAGPLAGSEMTLEDVMLGAVPGLPKVHLHNNVLAYETGDAFMAPFHQAARGELYPFVFVVEGSIPTGFEPVTSSV
jgi:hydrogenase small subunit